MKTQLPFVPIPALLSAGLLALCLVAPLAAQNLDLPYSSGSTGADGPFVVPAKGNPAQGYGLAYDAARQQVVKFGGVNKFYESAASVNNETWIYSAGSWLQKTPALSPSARQGCMMAYDSVRQKVILFGGRTAAGVNSNETWLWDGTNWALVSPPSSPPGRTRGTLVWDGARGKAVLFGGQVQSGGAFWDSTSGILQDTWIWDGDTWTNANPASSPSPRRSHAMAYYPPDQTVILMAGINTDGIFLSDIWSWNGQNWSQIGSLPLDSVSNLSTARFGASLAFDPLRSEMLLHGGMEVFQGSPQAHPSSRLQSWTPGGVWKELPGRGAASADHSAVWDATAKEMVVPYGHAGDDFAHDGTWAWDGTGWTERAGSTFMFDLRSKPEAIWNFTSINIPAGITVTFRKNAANNGVLWLASESVVISGTVNAEGSNGSGPYTLASAPGAEGGPGGFRGGRASTAGEGPGGGAPGTNALHANAAGSGPYGSLFAQPALGGSGGGGYFNYPALNWGSTGGGGGGAVVISSSRDVVVNGSILAKGGVGIYTSGSGSGGLIRIVGDRITLGASALIDAGDALSTGMGRIRVEGYIRTIPNAATQLKGSKSLSVPIVGSVLTQAGGRLSFAKVAGTSVAPIPKGDLINPDVIFTASGAVEIEVHAVNVPDGTPVTVTINHSSAGVINLPAVTLQQCKATFSATIPAGNGVMQALATYNVGGPTGNGQP